MEANLKHFGYIQIVGIIGFVVVSGETMAVQKPLLTEFGIHHGKVSCTITSQTLHL